MTAIAVTMGRKSGRLPGIQASIRPDRRLNLNLMLFSPQDVAVPEGRRVFPLVLALEKDAIVFLSDTVS